MDSRLKPEIFRPRVPCQDCPFRKEGGVRHGRNAANYIRYFQWPGSTFPCHKSVPKELPRDRWTEWQVGQVLCVGGLLFAAKQGWFSAIVGIGVTRGWYRSDQHTPEELATVFDTPEDMLTANKSQA